jgi:hypothetical protein
MVSLQSMSKSHIDITLSCANLNVVQWRFTGFYGEPRRELRKESWYLLRFLRAHSVVPWLCAGDFNEVLHGGEHFAKNEREEWHMNAFQDVVEDCRLIDLGFQGLPYTWDNKQDGERNFKAQLDPLGMVAFWIVWGRRQFNTCSWLSLVIAPFWCR